MSMCFRFHKSMFLLMVCIYKSLKNNTQWNIVCIYQDSCAGNILLMRAQILKMKLWNQNDCAWIPTLADTGLTCDHTKYNKPLHLTPFPFSDLWHAWDDQCAPFCRCLPSYFGGRLRQLPNGRLCHRIQSIREAAALWATQTQVTTSALY